MYNIKCSGRATNLKLGGDKIDCVWQALKKTIYHTNFQNIRKEFIHGSYLNNYLIKLINIFILYFHPSLILFDNPDNDIV